MPINSLLTQSIPGHILVERQQRNVVAPLEMNLLEVNHLLKINAEGSKLDVKVEVEESQ